MTDPKTKMSLTQTIKTGWRDWTPVFLLIFIAAFIRLRMTSAADYYLLEGDGPYYPLQVRSLIENYRLALPDVPLVFLIEAAFTKIFQLFTTYSTDECVLMSIRLTDAFIPPLAAIPVFLIARELESKYNFYTYLVVGYSILGFSPVLAFSQCLHKNGLAVLWAFYYCLYLVRFIKYSKKKHLYLALLFLTLCALTHFGSFSILLLLSVSFWFFWWLKNKANSPNTDYRKLLPFIFSILIFILCVAIFDLARLKRLLLIPINIFEAPLILFALNGQGFSSHTNVFNLVTIVLLFLIALVILFAHRKNMTSSQRSMSNILLFCTFLMINPFLGADWANRLYIMAYIPITILYLLFFVSVKNRWLKFLPAGLLLTVICLSISTGLFKNSSGVLNSEAYSEFRAITNKITFSKNSVVVGNRDIRLLASWFFRTKSAADYAITKEDINRFNKIYVIQHRKDTLAPVSSTKIFQGKHFDIYELLNPYQWVYENKGSAPKLRGLIEAIDSNTLTILNTWSGKRRITQFSDRTKIRLNKSDSILKKGMYVEVWGQGKPFSLVINAEEIIAKKYSGQ